MKRIPKITTERIIDQCVKNAPDLPVGNDDIAQSMRRVLWEMYEKLGKPSREDFLRAIKPMIPDVIKAVGARLRATLDQQLENITVSEVTSAVSEEVDRIDRFFIPKIMHKLSQSGATTEWECGGRGYLTTKKGEKIRIKPLSAVEIFEIYVDGKKIPFSKVPDKESRFTAYCTVNAKDFMPVEKDNSRHYWAVVYQGFGR